MSRLVVTLATLAAALGLAVPAAHAATWSAPTTLSAPHTFVGPLAVGGGGTVVAWPWQDSVGQDAPGGAAFAGRPPTGVFGPERPAPTGLLDVGAYGSTRTLALAMTIAPGSGPTGAQNQRLAYAYGRRDGGFEATRTLHTGPIVYRPQLAVNGVGRALIAWVEVTRTSSGGTRRIVRAAERTGSRGFGAPVTLSGQGRADAIAVAVGDRGDEALVVVRQGRLLARVKRTGHGWGSFFELARADGATRWQLDAAADLKGQVRVVWRRHQLSRSGAAGRTALESAYMASGRFTFGAAQTVEPDGAGQARLVAVPSGWALTYVLTTADGPRPALRLTPARGPFGAAQLAGPARGGLRTPDVAYDDVAGYVVVWIQPLPGQGGDGVVQSAELPSRAGAAFGPVTDVSPAEAAHEVRVLRSGPAHTVAVWTARPEGTGPGIPQTQIHSVVRSATRTP